MKKSQKQIIELTSIRGLAAWWVVFYHFGAYWDDHLGHWATTFFGQGFLAVDLFFILSGFVIFLVHGTEFTSLKWSEVQSFLIKRLARIYPLHIAILLLYLSVPISHVLFSSSGNIPGRYEPLSFFYNILLIQNWGQYPIMSWNIPSWSISAEWAAYLCFPVIGLCTNLVSRSTGLMLAALAGLLIFPAILISILGIESLGEMIIGSGVFRCLFQFSIGCVLCAFYLKHAKVLQSFATLMFCIGVAAFVPVGLGLVSDIFLAPMAFTVIILSLTGEHSPLTGLLRTRPVIYLGKISYSTYMIHYLVYDWFKLLFVETEGEASLAALIITLPVVLLLSSALHHVLEKPAQKVFRSLGQTRTAGEAHHTGSSG